MYHVAPTLARLEKMVSQKWKNPALDSKSAQGRLLSKLSHDGGRRFETEKQNRDMRAEIKRMDSQAGVIAWLYCGTVGVLRETCSSDPTPACAKNESPRLFSMMSSLVRGKFPPV